MKLSQRNLSLQVLAPALNSQAPREMLEFWRLWREEKFFDCHEVLEELWRQECGTRRIALNVLIHAAVAIYQHRRGNAVGAARQLLRLQTKWALLDAAVAGKYLRTDITALVAAIAVEIEPSLEAVSDPEKAIWPALQKSIQARVRRELERDA